MVTITLDPEQSQEIYEYVINERTKLPISYDYGDAVLAKDQLLEIYEYVASNRAKTRGTKLYLEVKDSGDVVTIVSEAIKIAPEEIITPRRKNCTGSVRNLRTFYPNVLIAERRIKDNIHNTDIIQYYTKQ